MISPEIELSLLVCTVVPQRTTLQRDLKQQDTDN
jgi:hypothetical protein